jgi:thiol-disulfide isomerase/thioredoxin
MKYHRFGSFAGFAAACMFTALLSIPVFGQNGHTQKAGASKLPVVKQIDAVGLKEVMKPAGRPLFVNFWATWCDPCRDEFPDLVKFSNEYKGRIDFITISLDDLAEIKRDVPIFLGGMKAEMPSYLLKTPDEDAAITSLQLPWQGALPFSVLFNEKGEIAYVRPGKVKPDLLRVELEKLLPAKPSESAK